MYLSPYVVKGLYPGFLTHVVFMINKAKLLFLDNKFYFYSTKNKNYIILN